MMHDFNEPGREIIMAGFVPPMNRLGSYASIGSICFNLGLNATNAAFVSQMLQKMLHWPIFGRAKFFGA